jgi:hypothetical protein
VSVARSEREVIAALLQQLESEERTLSRRRQKLHARIATFTDTTGSWAREEREISAKRRALHRQIDALLESTDKARGTGSSEKARSSGQSSSDVTA